ncbi:hypothetical protein [uncultured Campylobacter sp.]|nr:hypothetical protein [uncultured Campylobacter sp.]
MIFKTFLCLFVRGIKSAEFEFMQLSSFMATKNSYKTNLVLQKEVE